MSDREVMAPRFAEYCIRITNVRAFFGWVTRALQRERDGALTWAFLKPVAYAARLTLDRETPADAIGFINRRRSVSNANFE